MSYQHHILDRHVVGRIDMWLFTIIVAAVWTCQISGSASQTTDSSFRSLFVRHSNKRLSSVTAKFLSNSSVADCSDRCIREVEFQCKSFDFDNRQKACLLFSVSVDDRDVHLIDSDGKDHFETAYTRLFNRLPTHRLPVEITRSITGVSPEACARYCIMESYFKCRGFNYRGQDERCMLLDNNPATSTGAIYSEDIDYYEKKPEGPLARFVNFGMGRMKPLATGLVHQRAERGHTLLECAQLCMDQTSFSCQSFDYLFEGVDSSCYLSQYIAANVGGLVIDATNIQHNHYEKIGRNLEHFYATPYGIIPGNNLKTYNHVTPDMCALYCIKEDSFVCRSFDYRVVDSTCMLSDLAGSDVGGLTTEGGYQGDVHHFEMKPILDCGGNLTAATGSIASPNWPRDYTHHEMCVWHISTIPYKVLRLTFTHFQLGSMSSDPCDTQDDHLTIEEWNHRSYCILPNTNTIDTKSNQITVTFQTNGDVDAQGFRMFYEADWTCNENLDAPADIASPKWPSPYPPGSRCSWKLTAPPNQRVALRFTDFQLESHALGHCNDKYDHVKVLDGGTVNSPLVGMYCGSLSSFFVRSSGRDMFVQFVSDNDGDNAMRGFHAQFVLEPRNNTFFSKDVLAGPGYSSAVNDDKSDDNQASGHVGEDGPDGYISLADHHQYKTTMWALITLLMLLLVAACVGMFLLYRYYRGRIHREHEMVEEDGVVMPMVTVPTSNLCRIKPNNDPESMAAAGVCQASSDGDCAGAVAGPSADHDRKINNLDLCSKYAKDNEKNINVHKKNLDLEHSD